MRAARGNIAEVFAGGLQVQASGAVSKIGAERPCDARGCSLVVGRKREPVEDLELRFLRATAGLALGLDGAADRGENPLPDRIGVGAKIQFHDRLVGNDVAFGSGLKASDGEDGRFGRRGFREMIGWRRTTIMAASTTGSMVFCGIEPCPRGRGP